MKSRTIGCLLLLFVGSLNLLAQSKPVFEAYSNARQVLLDSYFEVTYTLKNGDVESFKAPAFHDFVVISGPARGMSTTIVNGRVSKEVSYSYTLQPRKPGTFSISSAMVTVGGQLYRSPEIKVDVLQNSQKGTSPDKKYYVDVQLSADEVYVGQQVRLDYKMYTTVEVQNFNLIEESDYVGFYAEDIKRPDTRVQREIINGVEYYTRILKSVALYPQQTGELNIDPAVMQLGVVTNSRRSPSSIFFGNDIRRVPVQTEATRVRVRSLPEGAPASFNGAVGHFNMQTSLKRNVITTDDALELKVIIEGDGDLKRIQQPQINFPASFEVYDPTVREFDLGENTGFRFGQKEFNFPARPLEPGQYTIVPEFTYFNPDTAAYITLRETPYNIRVRQGNKRTDQPNLDVQEQEETAVLSGLKKVSLRKKPFFLVGSAPFWALTAAPFVFLGVVVLRKRKQQQEANVDPALRKKQAAGEQAMQRLKQAQSHQSAGAARDFYDEVSRAMLGYVSDKLHIPTSELSKNNVRTKLQSLQVSEQLIEQFMSVLQTSEMALYAGKDNAEAMQQTYDNAFEVLQTLEQG